MESLHQEPGKSTGAPGEGRGGGGSKGTSAHVHALTPLEIGAESGAAWDQRKARDWLSSPLGCWDSSEGFICQATRASHLRFFFLEQRHLRGAIRVQEEKMLICLKRK